MPVLKNPRHEAYVQALITGMSQRQAYITAYPHAAKWKEDSVDNKAYNVLKRGEVWARYNELQHELANAAVMTAEYKRNLLKSFADNEDNSITDRLKAIDIDNKMSGEYISKVAVSADESVLKAAREMLGGIDSAIE